MKGDKCGTIHCISLFSWWTFADRFWFYIASSLWVHFLSRFVRPKFEYIFFHFLAHTDCERMRISYPCSSSLLLTSWTIGRHAKIWVFYDTSKPLYWININIKCSAKFLSRTKKISFNCSRFSWLANWNHIYPAFDRNDMKEVQWWVTCKYDMGGGGGQVNKELFLHFPLHEPNLEIKQYEIAAAIIFKITDNWMEKRIGSHMLRWSSRDLGTKDVSHLEASYQVIWPKCPTHPPPPPAAWYHHTTSDAGIAGVCHNLPLTKTISTLSWEELHLFVLVFALF